VSAYGPGTSHPVVIRDGRPYIVTPEGEVPAPRHWPLVRIGARLLWNGYEFRVSSVEDSFVTFELLGPTGATVKKAQRAEKAKAQKWGKI
jgi:hypothetical protein